MTKSELIDTVAHKVERLTRADVETAVNTIFKSMAQSLLQEERIEIRGFGSFVVRHRKARDGRNPKTGDSVAIPERRTPFFTVGKELRERVNSGRSKL
ncbi:MAG: integration host factor subunit beta [Deltaproteobacteria bacterium]|nr:integration host factor subunit beta [Deltaproteobacteria bacterium]